MIYIPKYQDIENKQNIVLVGGGLKGRFKITATKADGSNRTRLVADWFDNVITNNGLDLIFRDTGATRSNASLGTGTTAASVTDTGITSGYGSATRTVTGGAQASAPYYAYCIDTYRFNPRGSSATYSEVGIYGTGAAPVLWSRELIKDGSGSPTTISIASDEYVDVSYEIRLYPSWTASDNTISSVSITGSGTHTFTVRALGVTSWSINNNVIYGSGIGSAVYVSNGGLASITSSQITGTVAPGPNYGPFGSYSAGTYTRSATNSWGLTAGNVSGGITALSMSAYSGGNYQMSVSPAIAKDSNKTLSLSYNWSYSRL